MVKENTYNYICELQKSDLYNSALKCGIISITINYQKDIYERFLHRLSQRKGKVKNPITQAISDTSKDFNISEEYVKKIRRFMSK